MDNPLIALGSLIAVSLLVLLNWRLGGWKAARLADADAASRRWRQDYWDDGIDALLRDREGRSALLMIGGGAAIGLIVARGEGFATRRLGRASFKTIGRPEPGRLLIGLDDFSLPRAELAAEPDAIDRFLSQSGLSIDKKEAATRAA